MKENRLITFSGDALELLPQLFVLRADADRAGVGMALTHHDAAHGDQAGGADAELLGAEHGGDHHVAPGLDAAVGAQFHPMAQPVQHQHLVRLGQAHFPRQARIFDRALRRRAGAARMAGNQDRVGFRLGDAGGDRADARARHQLHADRCVRIDLLQVVDELRQVFDRVDIVMRRRADQRDARRRMAQPRDQRR